MAKGKNQGIFAAVGAATGLGNAFRFPALCAQYGCAFIIIYAVALILVGFPLLYAELKQGSSRRGGGSRIYSAIICAATANSALIALYYGGIATKLASASIGYILAGTPDCPAYISCLTVLAVFAAVCVVLAKGATAMGVTGKLSVCLSFALFVPLAAVGLKAIDKVQFDPTVFASGAAWSEGVGQALLSLSLAAGVMPAFAANLPKGFSPAKTAGKIILANFVGCVIATLAILPFASYIPIGGVSVAFTVFPLVICALSSNPIITCALCAFAFAALSVVAVHSLCSLAYPLVSKISQRIKIFPVIFCIACAALVPVFALNDCEILNACDRAACCINAVIIAFAESLCYAKTVHIKGVIAFFIRFVCPSCCAFAATLSLCAARFSSFSPLATFSAVIAVFVPLSAAAACILLNGEKREVKLSV